MAQNRDFTECMQSIIGYETKHETLCDNVTSPKKQLKKCERNQQTMLLLDWSAHSQPFQPLHVFMMPQLLYAIVGSQNPSSNTIHKFTTHSWWANPVLCGYFVASAIQGRLANFSFCLHYSPLNVIKYKHAEQLHSPDDDKDQAMISNSLAPSESEPYNVQYNEI